MAAASASGALLGLMFVAVSISISKITAVKHLSKLAFQPVSLLLFILIASIFVLIPDQPVFALGIEIAGSWIFLFIITISNEIIVYRQVKNHPKKKDYLLNVLYSHIALLPVIAGGLLLAFNVYAGMYCIVPGIMFAFGKATFNSWTILIELNR